MDKKKMAGEREKILLDLARSAIGAALGEPSAAGDRPIKEGLDDLDEKRGCFVTLRKNGALRGCVGTIDPLFSLAEGVERNALNAAFNDYRFEKLTRDEWPDVDIEISVLTRPKKMEFSDHNDLFSKIKPGVHGVILSKGGQRATFLPQVWKELPRKEDFFDALCQKAGLGTSCWKKAGFEVNVYEARHFSEKQPGGNARKK